MSVQRRFNHQYDRWLLSCHALGSDRRWPTSMAFALARLQTLLRIEAMLKTGMRKARLDHA